MGKSDFDKDSFWDLDKLVPKKGGASLKTFSSRPTVVDFEVPGEKSESSSGNKLTFDGMVADNNESKEAVYIPESGLIKKIKIKHAPDKFDFHANFIKAAMLYFDFKGSECDFAQFYSYMPQYTQLTQSQKNYYFYWRSMVRRGKYIKTDYSYFYLFVYEIINLPDMILPSEGIKLLVDLWREYRKDLPNISANMALWIQDYCLIYNLKCPMEKIGEFVFSSVGASGFKEFYLSGAEPLSDSGILAFIAYLSDYDWRCGKYAGGENREAYERHLIGAMRLFLSTLFERGELFSENDGISVMERSAFRSALTTAASKYRITVEYRAIAENAELRALVTSALRYTENKLRALIGTKSRLAVKDFSIEYKNVIDRYFSSLFDKVNRDRMLASRPEYERLYEAESSGFSLEDADEIEKSSWETTARLVESSEDFENSIEFELKSANMPAKAEFGGEAPLFWLDGDRLLFLAAALSEDTEKMKSKAAELGILCDSLADEINEAASDNFGDVILEASDSGYAVINDYKEDVEKWLKSYMK